MCNVRVCTYVCVCVCVCVCVYVCMCLCCVDNIVYGSCRLSHPSLTNTYYPRTLPSDSSTKMGIADKSKFRTAAKRNLEAAVKVVEAMLFAPTKTKRIRKTPSPSSTTTTLASTTGNKSSRGVRGAGKGAGARRRMTTSTKHVKQQRHGGAKDTRYEIQYIEERERGRERRRGLCQNEEA